MSSGSGPSALQSGKPTFAELFTPKLVTALREGYGPARSGPMPLPA